MPFVPGSFNYPSLMALTFNPILVRTVTDVNLSPNRLTHYPPTNPSMCSLWSSGSSPYFLRLFLKLPSLCSKCNFLSPEVISFPTALSKVIVSSPASLAILSIAGLGGRTCPLVLIDSANHCPFFLPNLPSLANFEALCSDYTSFCCRLQTSSHFSIS